jgi:hypothetical protein
MDTKTPEQIKEEKNQKRREWYAKNKDKYIEKQKARESYQAYQRQYQKKYYEEQIKPAREYIQKLKAGLITA